MFSGAPRVLVALLITVLILQLAFALLSPGSLILPLMKVALLAVFTFQVLDGKESAAKVLAILMLIGAALDVFSLVPLIGAGSGWAFVFLAFPAFNAGVALYIFRSDTVRRFLAERAYPG